MCSGEPVEFEFNSADAQTAAVLLMRSAGARTSRTLGAHERLIIQSLVSQITTTTAFIFADTDGGGTLDAGDLMVPLGTGNSSIVFDGTGDGIAGAVGVMPKVKAAAAGQIYIAGIGLVVKD